MEEAEQEKLKEKLKDLMVAERAPGASQLEIKLHMDRMDRGNWTHRFLFP